MLLAADGYVGGRSRLAKQRRFNEGGRALTPELDRYAALETFAVTILLYIVSGLFLLMAFGLVSAFGASKNLGVLLGALVYGAGGIFAITMTSWWPLLVGVRPCDTFALRWGRPDSFLIRVEMVK